MRKVKKEMCARNCAICKHPDRAEEWRPIKGFEGLYEVSSLGRVKSVARVVERQNNAPRHVRERIVKLNVGSAGYRILRLYKGGKGATFKVHRLVAEAFIPRIEGKDVVNHIDGNKLNNAVDNLEWCTYSENSKHAYDTGLNTSAMHKACKAAIAKTSRPVVRGDGVEFPSINRAAAGSGLVYCRGIAKCCDGLQERSGGYTWRWADA